MVEKFQSYDAIRAQIADGYEYFMVYDEENLAGYIGIHAEPAKGELFLSKLYIHKDYRGKHLATQAVAFLKTLCQERELHKIWLTCNKHNTRTLAVYAHLGFQNVRSQVADIGNGFVMDDYILELS
jgi:RimJ/RimL family protein N-acetyltransferase